MDRLERRFHVKHRCDKVKNTDWSISDDEALQFQIKSQLLSVSFIDAIFFNDNSTVLRSFGDCFLNAVFHRRPGCAANFTIALKESYFLVDRSGNKKRKASFRGKRAFD